MGRERGGGGVSDSVCIRMHTQEVSVCPRELSVDGGPWPEQKRSKCEAVNFRLPRLTNSPWLLCECVQVVLCKHFWKVLFNNQVPVRVRLEKAVTLGISGSGD